MEYEWFIPRKFACGRVHHPRIKKPATTAEVAPGINQSHWIYKSIWVGITVHQPRQLRPDELGGRKNLAMASGSSNNRTENKKKATVADLPRRYLVTNNHPFRLLRQCRLDSPSTPLDACYLPHSMASIAARDLSKSLILPSSANWHGASTILSRMARL